MTRYVICLVVLILLGTRLCAQPTKDTIPPIFIFGYENISKLLDAYPGEYNLYESEIVRDTTIVSLSCRISFPGSYNVFEDPVFKDEAVYPDTSYVDVTNYEDFSVTRIWTATDASGNIAKWYYILQYNGSTYTPSVEVNIEGIELTEIPDFEEEPAPEAYIVCVNEEITLNASTTNDCSDNVKTTWYLDGDNKADAEGEVLTYKWEKPGEYTIRVIGNGNVFNGFVEKRYKISVTPGLTLLPDKLNAGQINTAYPTVFYSATGGTGTGYQIKYVLTGSLPTGMSFNADAATLTGTPVQAGSFTFTITATDQEKCPGSQVYTLVINKTNQTITFNPLPEKTYGDPPFTINATASSNLPVSFSSSDPKVATVSGNTIRLTGPGQVTIRAAQGGDATYNAAPNVERSFIVKEPPKQSQTITFTPVPEKTFGDAPFTLTATASSGLPVTFIIVPDTAAALNGNTVTIKRAGSITVRASQPGNNAYNPAPAVDIIIIVKKASQIITFEEIPDKYTVDAPFTINATATSSLPVNFEVVSGPAKVVNNTVTLDKGIGKVSVRASQGGNANYHAAPPVERSFNVHAVLGTEPGWAISLTVYPNPTSNTLYVQLPEPMRQCKLSLVNSSGLLVSEQSNNLQKEAVMAVAHLRRGLYLLHVSNGKVNITRKVLLQ